MTLPTDARTVAWSPDTAEGYILAAQPNQDICNAFLVELIACSDRLCAGSDLMAPGAATWLLPTDTTGDGATIFVVGGATTTTINARGLTEVGPRADGILALAWVGRSIGARRTGTAGVPWVPLAVGAVVVAIVGVAVAWFAQGESRASQAERVTHAGILAGNRDYAEQLRVAAQTGQPIAPPTPVMIAAAESIRSAAAQAREAGIGQTIAEAASGVGKAVAAVVAMYVAFTLFTKSRS
jgi:hypothetical protein